MIQRSQLETLSTGLALFSMFFGAGNVVFPLMLGMEVTDSSPLAILGLILTAVIVPFIGLTTLFFYKGDYKAFFSRLGEVPAFLIILLIIALIGPFGALPRCIALTFSTMKIVVPMMNPIIYSAVACVIVFFLAYSESEIINILGNFLTPALLGLLLLIITIGLLNPPAESYDSATYSLDSLWLGIREGYQTMDLLGAFFFSSVVMTSLIAAHKKIGDGVKSFRRLSFEASVIAAFLLAFVYASFCYLSSLFASELVGVPDDMILGALAVKTLGTAGGLVTALAVMLACLTTAIALAAVSAHFIQVDLMRKKVDYHVALGITMVISFFISIMEFSGIVKFLIPILDVCYPSLILLTFLNLAHKLWGIKIVKAPVLALFLITLGLKLFA